MAHTEEIAEKLADLLLEQAPRTANFAMDEGKKFVDGVSKTSRKTLNDFLTKAETEKQNERLHSLRGEVSVAEIKAITKDLGMKARTFRVTHSDLQDFEKLVKEQDILYAKLNISDDDGYAFVFLERDEQQFMQAYEILKAQRGAATEVTPKMYVDHLAPENVEMLGGLDDVEVTLFRHYARRFNLLFTVLDQGDNSHTVVYGAQDADKARRAMLHTGWDLTGANGALYRKQVEYRLEGHNKICLSAEEAAGELYIVSKDRPDNYVHITEADYTLYKAGKAVSKVERTKDDFVSRCVGDALGLENGVVLTSDEYFPGISYEDIADRPTVSLHVPDYEEDVEISRVNGLISLVEQRGGDGDPAVYGIENHDVKYEAYEDLEFIMDDEERAARGYEFEHFKDAAYYAQDHLTHDSIEMDQHSVDYIIARANERRAAAQQPVNERDKYGPTTNPTPPEPLL